MPYCVYTIPVRPTMTEIKELFSNEATFVAARHSFSVPKVITPPLPLHIYIHRLLSAFSIRKAKKGPPELNEPGLEFSSKGSAGQLPGKAWPVFLNAGPDLRRPAQCFQRLIYVVKSRPRFRPTTPLRSPFLGGEGVIFMIYCSGFLLPTKTVKGPFWTIQYGRAGAPKSLLGPATIVLVQKWPYGKCQIRAHI